MPPRTHAHGGGEEEEVVVVRTDGPPFVDLKADPGAGFEHDFHKVEMWLGPGKVRAPAAARARARALRLCPRGPMPPLAQVLRRPLLPPHPPSPHPLPPDLQGGL